MTIDKVFILKFIKFGVVGASGVVVDFAITYICKEYLKIQKYVSNAIGFTVAASTNYILNRIWTFKSSNPDVAHEYFLFILMSLVGLAINTAVIWFLNGKLKKNFYVSKLFAIGAATLWNFFANLLITFAK